MAISSEDHQKLYSDLRSALLARHFAFSRYFRANCLSLWNELGRLHNPYSLTPDDKDDKPLTTCVENVRPPVTIDDYTRWLVADHERENLLLYGAQLFTCLAVEYLISQSTDTLTILKEDGA